MFKKRYPPGFSPKECKEENYVNFDAISHVNEEDNAPDMSKKDEGNQNGKWICFSGRDVGKLSFDYVHSDASRKYRGGVKIQMDFPKQISEEEKQEIECEVTNEEIKRAVWECGSDKAPGPDGFTFGFFRRFWDLIKSDV
ncbi:hypothetical protein Tco_0968071 [Tanacetum coccineum]